MTEVRDIASVGDLRSTAFSGLLYEILDSADGYDVAKSIVKRIDPGFEGSRKTRAAYSEEELFSLKEELEQFRAEAEFREKKHSERFIKSPAQQQEIAWFQSMHKDLLSSYMLREEGEREPESDKGAGADEALDYSKVDYGAMLERALSDGVARRLILEFGIAYSSHSFERFMEEIDVKLHRPSEDQVKKYLAALLLLPKLEDDQDIIVFFGNNFHKTLGEVNAYTGLLYAYEYFEYVGIA